MIGWEHDTPDAPGDEWILSLWLALAAAAMFWPALAWLLRAAGLIR